jgi:hypothetical protein
MHLDCVAVVAHGIRPIVPRFRRPGGKALIGGQSEHGKRRVG